MINMKKKFISLLMIIAMMFSMLPANVVDIKAATGKTAIISVEGKNAIPGSTVSVNVSIKDNSGILGSVLRVEYDSKLTLTDAKSGEAFSTLVMTKPGKFGSPSKFVWDGQDLPITGSQNSNSVGFFYLYGSAPCWYYEWTRTVVASYKTQYRYADRSKSYTYLFKKVEQKESTSEIQESDSVSNVQKWVKYTI